MGRPLTGGILAAGVLLLVTVDTDAAPVADNDTMTVTVSAGPILVMEAPTDEDSTTQNALVESGLSGLAGTVEAALRAESWTGASPESGPDSSTAVALAPLAPLALTSARGRRVRDLAGLLRRAAHRFIRSLGNELRDLAEGTGPPAGRRKKGDAYPMLGAGLIMGGTLLTIGLGALAAMSGKALMSAMLALGMSLMSAFRPARRCRRSGDNGCDGNGNGNNDNYEIIARPVITHGHTHSAVLHHDPSMGMGAAGYPGYVRSLVQAGPADQIPASMQTSPTTVDVTDFARSGATRLVSNGPSAHLLDPDESNPASWVGGVIGMRGSPSAQPPPPPASDSVLSLTLGTWGQGGQGQGQPPGQYAKHRLGGLGHAGGHASASTQPRAMASRPPGPQPSGWPQAQPQGQPAGPAGGDAPRTTTTTEPPGDETT